MTQHYGRAFVRLSVTYAEYTNNPFILSVDKLDVVMLNVAAPLLSGVNYSVTNSRRKQHEANSINLLWRSRQLKFKNIYNFRGPWGHRRSI
jgi:hypothetical protein